MATKVTIGGGSTLFMGTDKRIEFNLKDASGAPVDATGFTLLFVVKRTVNTATVILSKSVSVVGLFTPTSNVQRLVLQLDDTELIFNAGTYQYSLKRLDAGAEEILAEGNFIVQKATQV